MDVRRNARSALTNERTTDMADMRRCIGSEKFGIEAHEAPTDDFPVQPSQKDGLGRMCKTHWNQYTNALRKAALARKAAEGDGTTEVAVTKAASAPAGSRRGRTTKPDKSPKPEPIRTRSPRRTRAQTPAGGSQGDAD
jgi:hypothetical protein